MLQYKKAIRTFLCSPGLPVLDGVLRQALCNITAVFKWQKTSQVAIARIHTLSLLPCFSSPVLLGELGQHDLHAFPPCPPLPQQPGRQRAEGRLWSGQSSVTWTQMLVRGLLEAEGLMFQRKANKAIGAPGADISGATCMWQCKLRIHCPQPGKQIHLCKLDEHGKAPGIECTLLPPSALGRASGLPLPPKDPLGQPGGTRSRIPAMQCGTKAVHSALVHTQTSIYI